PCTGEPEEAVAGEHPMSRGTAKGAPHLADQELVDALDGTLDARRLAHVSTCASCTMQLEEFRTIAGEAGAAGVPEPPAFFWNQLSGRVPLPSGVCVEPLAARRALVNGRGPRAGILVSVVAAMEPPGGRDRGCRR